MVLFPTESMPDPDAPPTQPKMIHMVGVQLFCGYGTGTGSFNGVDYFSVPFGFGYFLPSAEVTAVTSPTEIEVMIHQSKRIETDRKKRMKAAGYGNVSPFGATQVLRRGQLGDTATITATTKSAKFAPPVDVVGIPSPHPYSPNAGV
jgi:hypothetical protein